MDHRQKGQVSATKGRLPMDLAFYCAFQDKYKEFDFERYLKPDQDVRLCKRDFFK
jgi:hypothetical protein